MIPAALIAIGAGLVLFSGRSPAKKSSRKPIPKECQDLTSQGGHLAGVDYLELVTGGADKDARLPMVISLHGLGYDDTAHVRWLEKLDVPARIILPNAPIARSSESNRTWWSSYSNKALQNASKGLAQFVYLIQRCRPTSGAPILTGHSMGGFIALDFATQFPELISASVPMAATRSSALWDIEPRVPVHAIHGKLDDSYERALSYYQKMSQRGLPVYLTTVDKGAHRIASANADAWLDVLEHLLRSKK